MNDLPKITSAILFGLFTLTIWSCDREQQLKMTVVFYEHQSPQEKITIDTLVTDSIISRSKATIDIYFCSNKFHIPYHLPTGGVYKDSIKERECDMSIYPQHVKCYKYDEKNRVTTMSVSASGTTGDWNYEYDSKYRITGIEWVSHYYEIKYNDLGLLTDLTEDNGTLRKRIKIIYN